MKKILLFALSILGFPVLGDSIMCGSQFGRQEELSKLITIKSHENEMYEIFLPTHYREKELYSIHAFMKDPEGREGYFQLSFTEESGMYYLHLGLEPVASQVTISAQYGVGTCATYIGEVILKNISST